MLIRHPAHSDWKTETTGKLEFHVGDPDPHGSALFLGSRFMVRPHESEKMDPEPH